MAKLGYEFDSSVEAVGERQNFDPIPKDRYALMVVESEVEPTKNDGEMLVLKIQVVEGQYNGRLLFVRLNMKNANPEAERIARAEFGELCRAVLPGVRVTDSEQIHNRKFIGDVVVTPAKPYTDSRTGELKPGNPGNRINKYMPYGPGAQGTDNQASAPTAQAATSKPAVASSTPGGMPWKR